MATLARTAPVAATSHRSVHLRGVRVVPADRPARGCGLARATPRGEDFSSSSSASAPISAPVPPPAPVSTEFSKLQGIRVFHCSSGVEENLTELWGANQVVTLALLTHFADFDSWEYAQRLRSKITELADAKVRVVCVGIGSLEAARRFCDLTSFPKEFLWADPSGAAHRALGLSPGLQAGGVNAYMRLLAMCAGIGSPGTLPEVLRGYVGDRQAGQVFNYSPQDPRQIAWAPFFDVVGKGYQRPFELATLRLLNMTDILRDWEVLRPRDDELLLQRGGTLVMRGPERVWLHTDKGILGYADVDEVVRVAKAA